MREHLLSHISFLKERGILKGGVPAGFANVLMLHDEMKSQQVGDAYFDNQGALLF